MKREHLNWWSPSLEKQMELLAFGHEGTPILAFPSSMGRYFEWEDFKMADALSHQLENGYNQLICVDSVDSESFYNKQVDPFVRIKRYQQYEAYIINEVVPFIQKRSENGFIIAAGASFGAYHASNLVFKHPHLFGKLIALSGAYDIKSFMDGFYNNDVYFNNPIDYMSQLGDPDMIKAIDANSIVLTIGEGDPCKEANFSMSQILSAKGISHNLDMTPGFGHDWPFWRDLIRKHVA
jgi:esterase/lipase superfamily enzyme